MEEAIKTTPLPQEEEETQIDLMEIFAKLLLHWKQIVIIGIVFGVLGIISALTMTRYYKVTLTLAPEIQNRNSGGALSAISSLLGNGFQMNPATDAMNITLFPEICQSTPFLAGLLDVPLTSYVSEEDQEEGVQPIHTTVYRHLTKEDKEKSAFAKWLEQWHPEKPYTGVEDPTELTRKQAEVVKQLGENISAVVDNKTGVTTISVTMDDRLMAKQLGDTVCTRLQDFVSAYRTKKATADYEYYVMLAEEARQELVRAQAAYAASVDYDRSVILQSANSERDRLRGEVSLANQIYSQMAQQRELARAKIQEERPVYAVVQPAVLPQKPVNSRVMRVLLFGFLGGFLAVAWYGFGQDFLRQMRKDVEEKLEEEEKAS